MSEPLESKARFFVGHIHAVNAAAMAFAVLFGVKGLIEGASSSVPFPDRIWSFMIPVLVMGVLFWLFAVVTALLPVIASYLVACWLKIRSVFYYVACGALTGLALTPVYLAIPMPAPRDEQSYFADFVTWGPIFVTSASCGALAFWYRIGRHIEAERAETMSVPS